MTDKNIRRLYLAAKALLLAVAALSMADVYKLMDLIHKPPEMIPFCFPRSV